MYGAYRFFRCAARGTCDTCNPDAQRRACAAANAVGNFVDRRVQTFSDLTPSIQVLIGKLIRIVLVTFTVVVVLSSMGIDLSVFAFFSGAVGVGLGFGLQKIVSTTLN